MNALNALRNNFAINGGFFAFSGFAAGPSLGCGGPQGPMDSNSTCFAPEQCSGNALPNLMAAWGGGGADAIGQRGGARLQNVAGFDLEYLAVLHGVDVLPAGTCRHLLRAKLLAAPGADDDVGVAAHDLGGIGNDAVLAHGL